MKEGDRVRIKGNNCSVTTCPAMDQVGTVDYIPTSHATTDNCADGISIRWDRRLHCKDKHHYKYNCWFQVTHVVHEVEHI